MNSAQKLFDKCDDFLAHTLEHASQILMQPAQIQLNGATITLHQIGVLEYLPEHSQAEALVLSAGIHGNETAPIELLNLLVGELLKGQLVVNRPTLFVLGHPVAMIQQTRFIDHNMNRLFGEARPEQEPAKTIDAKRADLLKAELKRFHLQNPVREHYDLHTAIRKSIYPRFSVCPFQNTLLSQTAQYNFLQDCGVQAILLSGRPAATFSAFSAATFSSPEANTYSYTVELGQAHPFGENDLEDYQNTLKALRRLLSNQPAPERTASILRFFTVTHEIIHSGPGFSLNIAESAENFTAFSKGTEIWHDTQTRYRVQHSVEYIAFPNSQVKPGERAGLMLVEVEQAAQ